MLWEAENYVYYLVVQLEWKFDQKMEFCDLFQYIFIISLVSNEKKTISQGGGSNYFHLYFLLSYCDVWYGGTNLVNGPFRVKISNFNFLKIGLTNDFDSFCMHLWVNPTTLTHIRFPWSNKINLCHVLERCECCTLHHHTNQLIQCNSCFCSRNWFFSFSLVRTFAWGTYALVLTTDLKCPGEQVSLHENIPDLEEWDFLMRLCLMSVLRRRMERWSWRCWGESAWRLMWTG